MKKALLLLGVLIVVSFFACGNGCILQTRTITIVITDVVCTAFEEEHYDENYMDPTEAYHEIFEDLDEILDGEGMTRDDIVGAGVVGIYYQVLTGPGFGPWTVSGKIWINYGGEREIIATYQSVVLTGPMPDAARIDTDQAGLDLLDQALMDYKNGVMWVDYPTIVFEADRATGDVDPSPTEQEPLIFTWDGCLSMHVDFVETYDVYDLFPAD